MTPKEKAEHLYNIFCVFTWDEVEGFIPDNMRTIRNCINVCDEILLVLSDVDYNETDTTVYNTCLFYNKTITELKKML